MNLAVADRLAAAVLYEGYILYPYRPSLKNRQRWTFGGLYPEAFCRDQAGGDVSSNQTECLVRGSERTTIEVAVRFLHLVSRTVGEIAPSAAPAPWNEEPPFRPVQTLRVGDKQYHSWQEAEERTVTVPEAALDDLQSAGRRHPFTFSGGRCWEPIEGTDGNMAGVLVRTRHTLNGVVHVSAAQVGSGCFRVTVCVHNRTPLAQANGRFLRDEASLRALVSTNCILGIRQGEFVSLMDPPEELKDLAAACSNIGTWPILVGTPGQKDMIMSAPIILYDYPEIAPESPGDFFDGTEIDEILTLRIMTLTDEEKQAMAALDERGSKLLARTEALAREQLLGLHGVMRGVAPQTEEVAHG